MESITLVERLKDVIENEFKGLKEEIEQEKAKVEMLKGKNEESNKIITELKDDNYSLVKTLKDVKDKYNRLYDKLKRKQEEIHKKEKWWDKYRFTAETTIKKLRTLGTFSPDVLHEVSRDLVDIMDEGSSTESVSSQDGGGKKKLTTSKNAKKKFRYSEVSPDNLVSETKTAQQKDTEIKLQEQCTKSKIESQRSSGSSSISKPDIEQNHQKSILIEVDEQDETTSPGCPSLTSTPILTSAPFKLPSLPMDFSDLSIITKEAAANVSDNNRASKKAEIAGSDKKKEESKRTKRNLRVLINALDTNDINERDSKSPSILDTIVKTTCTTTGNNNSPSILPVEATKKTSTETWTGKHAFVKSRSTSNAGTGSGVKRKRMDDVSRPGCFQATSNQHLMKTPKDSDIDDRPDQGSVVLLSSGDEDDGKVASSSMDMFGDAAENSNPKSLATDKDVIEAIEQDNQDKNTDPPSIVPDKGKPNGGEEECSSRYVEEEFPGFRKPDEPKFKNIEVVRKKDDRAKLKGFSCRECAEYYGSLNLNDTELKKRLKKCSRHRAKHSPPPSTPPGFWNLSFPATQEYMEKGLLKTEEHGPPQKARRPRRRRLLAKAPLK